MRLRPEAVAFGVAVVGGWLLAASLGLSSAQRAGAETQAVSASAQAGRALLRQGSEAAARDDLAGAEQAFRKAWLVPAVRDEAASALRDLSRRPAYEAAVDEEALRVTADLLGPGFTRHETQHFVILSDAGRDWTLAKAALLERAHHQFFRVMDRMEYAAVPPEHKLHCVLFKEHAMYMTFARAHDGVEAPWVAGYYAGLSNRVVFYDDQTGPTFSRAFDELSQAERNATEMRSKARQAQRERQPGVAETLAARAEELDRRVGLERRRLREQATETSDAKTIHEAVHLLAFNCGVQSRARQYPFWLTEGMAVSFETDRPSAAFGPDHPSDAREDEFRDTLRDGRLIDLEALIQLAAPPDRDTDTVDAMYSESYALFTYLYRYERRSLAGFLADVWAEPPGPIAPQRQLELFRARFGAPEAVERRWLRRMGE